MTLDEAIDAFEQATATPLAAMRWVLDEWETAGPHCRSLLRDYAAGRDLSERTEKALHVIVHLLGERADTASFPLLCDLAMDTERVSSVFGEDGLTDTLLPILINTFDGNQAALRRLVETPTVDDILRGDALLVLAYLTRTRRVPEAEMYEYLAALPDRLQPLEPAYVWFGWVRAVAVLGFAGLAGRVEHVLQRGLVDPALTDLAGFWLALRDAQDDPRGTTAWAWDGIGPFGDAIEWLNRGESRLEPDAPETAAPVRNPLRKIGRNDPCPCGSGKKYKKCCLAA